MTTVFPFDARDQPKAIDTKFLSPAKKHPSELHLDIGQLRSSPLLNITETSDSPKKGITDRGGKFMELRFKLDENSSCSDEH